MLNDLLTRVSALYLRISVESGGCSGFQYVFLVENKIISPEEDLVYNKDGNMLTQSLTYSLTYSLTHLLNHSLTFSLVMMQGVVW